MRTKRQCGLWACALAVLLTCGAAAQTNRVPINGHVPSTAIQNADHIGRAPASERVDLALSLPLRNQAALDLLLKRLYDPFDPLYRQFLSPQEFTAQFGPTQADYQALVQWAQARGLTIRNTHPNRLLLDVSGTAFAVERAFQVELHKFQAGDGRIFRAPIQEPTAPASVAAILNGVIGLSTHEVWKTHSRMRNPAPEFGLFGLNTNAIGSGPGGGLTPSDVKAAYNLKSTTRTGAGQTLGLFELDGYVASDITHYEANFGLPNVPLQNVLVDGYNGSANSGRDEVTLDIELMIAMAPGAAKVMVYEGPNSSSGLIDTYNRIATDNIAKQISSSWGLYESGMSSATHTSENNIFQQMSAQGQSIYAAAGDSGAYDDGSTLSVDDPASQPFMTGVGGTTLSVTAPGGTWVSEKTWIDGGGGISSVWGIPSYQSGLISAASKGSTTKRNVPDVSLNADPNTGYAIYTRGAWFVYGGTSCAAPLWAGFTALVNEQRVANGKGVLGSANPALYSAGTGSNYGTDFHDIADNSNNQFYPAVTGLDDATGWGTFNGANLLTDLAGGGGATAPPPPGNLTAVAGNTQVSLNWSASAGATSYNVKRATTSGGPYSQIANVATTSYTNSGLTNGTTYYYVVTALNSVGESGNSNQASATPTSIQQQQLLLNPGFESGNVSWTATAGVIDNSTGRPPHTGSWKAWLDGYGTSHVDSLYQQVTIPANITTATLTFWIRIDSAETTTTTAYDTLQVQVRNSSNAVLSTLATYSNLNKNSTYVQKSFNLSAYKGQTIRVYLLGTEDSSLQTSFVVDDFALTVQ